MAKFHHFCNILRVYLVLGKVFISHWYNLNAFGRIFIVVNGQILKTQSGQSGHTAYGTLSATAKTFYIIDPRRQQRQMSIAAKVRDTWVHAIETSLLPEVSVNLYPTHPGYGSPKLLVIVNPFSGQKKAEKILTDEVVPFFSEAGIDFEVLVTRYAGHAREVIAQERLSDWRGLVSWTIFLE